MIDVFMRKETKYLLDANVAMFIKNELIKNGIHIDSYGKTSIQSLYYDTPDNTLITRSLEKPTYKEKLRLRSYGLVSINTPVFLEIKKKYDGIVYKRRIITSEKDTTAFINYQNDYSSQIGKELNAFRNYYKVLAPRYLIIYEREAYLDSKTDLRITFDENIRYRENNLDLHTSLDGTNLLDCNKVLMEIKTAYNYPIWLVKLLNTNHIYPISFSKIGRAYQKIKNETIKKGNILCQTYSSQFSVKEA